MRFSRPPDPDLLVLGVVAALALWQAPSILQQYQGTIRTTESAIENTPRNFIVNTANGLMSLFANRGYSAGGGGGGGFI